MVDANTSGSTTDAGTGTDLGTTAAAGNTAATTNAAGVGVEVGNTTAAPASGGQVSDQLMRESAVRTAVGMNTPGLFNHPSVLALLQAADKIEKYIKDGTLPTA